jgi:hypothetical protein
LTFQTKKPPLSPESYTILSRTTVIRSRRASARTLIEEALEDPAGDPHGALIGTQDDAELDGVAVLVPASIFRELEEQHA